MKSLAPHSSSRVIISGVKQPHGEIPPLLIRMRFRRTS